MRKIVLSFICVLLCLVLCACSLSDIKDAVIPPEPQKIDETNEELKKCFYKSGALSIFKPNQDYGSVVPYLCRSRIVADENEKFVTERIYGFATADGKIITDGAYKNIYTEASSDGRTLYVCEVVSGDDKMKHFQIIPSSGAELIEFSTPEKSKNKVVTFTSIPCECIIVPDMDSGMLLCDFDAKPIVNLTKVFGADCYFRIFYCDGERIIFNAGTDAESEAIGDNYFCINKNGDLLYTLDFEGSTIESFQGGCFIIGNKKGHRQLADVLGNVITPAGKVYSDIVYDRLNKNFWCCSKKKKTLEKIDSSGKVLLEKSIKKIKNPTWLLLSSPIISSILVQESENARNFLWFNVENGKKIKLDVKDLDYFGDISDEKYDYIAAYYDKTADLYDSSGTYIKTVMNIENYYGIHNGRIPYCDTDERLCIKGLRSTFEMKIPLDKEKVKEAWITDFSDEIIAFSYYCDEGEEAEYTVYSLETQQLLTENIKEYRFFETEKGKFYSGIVDETYVLKNSAGKTLIEIPEEAY